MHHTMTRRGANLACSKESHRWRACSRYTAEGRPQPPPSTVVYCAANAIPYCSPRPCPGPSQDRSNATDTFTPIQRAEQKTLNLR